MFERGISPSDLFGRSKNIKEALEKDHHHISDENPEISVSNKKKEGRFEVQIVGNLVIQNMEPIYNLAGGLDIQFFPETAVTVLDELSDTNIIERIKEFYGNVVKQCKGKPHEEQQRIIFGDEHPKGTNAGKPPKNAVEKTEDYLQRLDNNEEAIDQNNLIEKLNDDLEYGLTLKDANGVKIRNYRDALKKRQL
jgi:hypothetical protein